MRLIDADEMIKGICFIIEDSKKMLTSSVVRKAMLGLVERIKTVDAAPVVHGRWKDRHVFGINECTVDSLQFARCTNCGKYHTTPYMYYFDDFAYCPYCGAKMDGGEDDGKTT